LAWADTNLAEPGDVLSRSSDADQHAGDRSIADYLASTKELFGRKLDQTLRAKRDEITKTEQADLKDLINNLTVLKNAAVAHTLMRIHSDSIISEGDFHQIKRDEYQREYTEEWNIATSLIEYDSDQSGDISDEEAAAHFGYNRFERS